MISMASVYWIAMTRKFEFGRKPTPNRPFPLRHVDPHLTHECLGTPHSPRHTTARSLYALPHNDAKKVPICSNGTPQIHPKTAPSASTITAKISYTHSEPDHTQHTKRHLDPISRFATTHMCGQIPVCGQTRVDDISLT